MLRISGKVFLSLCVGFDLMFLINIPHRLLFNVSSLRCEVEPE